MDTTAWYATIRLENPSNTQTCNTGSKIQNKITRADFNIIAPQKKINQSELKSYSILRPAMQICNEKAHNNSTKLPTCYLFIQWKHQNSYSPIPISGRHSNRHLAGYKSPNILQNSFSNITAHILTLLTIFYPHKLPRKGVKMPNNLPSIYFDIMSWQVQRLAQKKKPTRNKIHRQMSFVKDQRKEIAYQSHFMSSKLNFADSPIEYCSPKREVMYSLKFRKCALGE